MGKKYQPIKPGIKWFKILVAKIVFFVLGRAFQFGAKFDPDIKREVSVWQEGFTLLMNIFPNGPRMALEKTGGLVKFRGGKLTQADIEINFKNVECAFLVLTPQIGAAQAFAERRMTVKGDLANSVIFTRCLNILLAYLYPPFICRMLLKRVPPMPLKKQFLRIYMYLVGIPFGV